MKKFFTILAISSVAFLTACDDNTSQSSQQRGQQTQENFMQRAIDSVPIPNVTQYPNRESVARYMDYTNNPDQTHYIYVMLPGVGFLGYYVSDAAPMNICTSLTPPQNVNVRTRGSDGITSNILSSPGLDGVYYGGSSCDMYYFFDVETGAKLEMGGQMAFFTSTVPLSIQAPRLRVETTNDE